MEKNVNFMVGLFSYCYYLVNHLDTKKNKLELNYQLWNSLHDENLSMSWRAFLDIKELSPHSEQRDFLWHSLVNLTGI